MSANNEAELEAKLIKQLEKLDYAKVKIANETDLLNNLKLQIEKHNNLKLSDSEFNGVMHFLNKGGIYQKSYNMRGGTHILLDDNKTQKSIEFLDCKDWCKNEFQVTSQVVMTGDRTNRYDVTILINGLPLVHIELKNRKSIREAFNQIDRYQRHSFKSSLYEFVQLFVISNGNDTRYHANNKSQRFEESNYWGDVENKKISNLFKFSKVFLEKCHIAKMVCRYIVLTAEKKLMVLRSYQYYAAEAILKKVKDSKGNGYIWHTTGSGKTLTSFKTSQIVAQLPNIDKVVFVVDRRDLDKQTKDEFNKFENNCVDTTDNTRQLVIRFKENKKIIVTTIQKLNRAICGKYQNEMLEAKDKKIVFIFDECHRSQFGETHKHIVEFFSNHQLFGFTGTPILPTVAKTGKTGKHTTAEFFGKCLHKYLITDAMNDNNVLGFNVECIKTFKKKEVVKDEDVEAINTKEVLSADKRLDIITDHIIKGHKNISRNGEFSAIFAVDSISTLIKYYDMFKVKKEEGGHNLTIATIFSYSANEEDRDIEDDGISGDIKIGKNINQGNQDKLEKYLQDYNQHFNSNFTTKGNQSYYKYYDELSQRVKNKKENKAQIDILLVVNMFLTGFDAKKVNTLYLDKNLKDHGLIQAYSRTNRIVVGRKPHGNIISFRDLTEETNKALEKFGDKGAADIVLMQPYEYYLKKYKVAHTHFKKIIKNPDDVDNLMGEEKQSEFIKAFRELLRYRNRLLGFSAFKDIDLTMNDELFSDYEDKYRALYERIKKDDKENQTSILDDIDFEIELIEKYIIDVDYILDLVKEAVKKDHLSDDMKRKFKDIFGSNPELSNKKDLLNRFIDSCNTAMTSEEVESLYNKILSDGRGKELNKLCNDFHLNKDLIIEIINNYELDEKTPKNESIFNAIEEKHQPELLDESRVVEEISNRLMTHIDRFL